MVGIVKFLEPNTTKHNLDKKSTKDFPRGYPGISGVGEPCLRKRQLEHYFAEKGEINARTQRIFSVGHLFEEIFYKEAREEGYEVWGDQQDLELLDGKLGGHCDGMIKGIPEAPKTTHVLELKTMNDKAWKDVLRNQVKKSKPVYYCQVQLYMKALKLDRALFVAINKNDCQYYVERIKSDNEYVKEQLNRTVDVFESEMLLPRISERRSYYACGWCTYKSICHENTPIRKTCRSCIASNYVKGMTWNCWLKKKDLTRAEQIDACEKYQIQTMFEPNGCR